MNKNKIKKFLGESWVKDVPANSPLGQALTPLERELKAARSLEKLLASMPKKLNVKPEPTFKPNPHLPGTKL